MKLAVAIAALVLSVTCAKHDSAAPSSSKNANTPEVRQILAAVEEFQQHRGHLPTASSIAELRHKLRRYDNDLPKDDAHGRRFQVKSSETHFQLFSSDGQLLADKTAQVVEDSRTLDRKAAQAITDAADAYARAHHSFPTATNITSLVHQLVPQYATTLQTRDHAQREFHIESSPTELAIVGEDGKTILAHHWLYMVLPSTTANAPAAATTPPEAAVNFRITDVQRLTNGPITSVFQPMPDGRYPIVLGDINSYGRAVFLNKIIDIESGAVTLLVPTPSVAPDTLPCGGYAVGHIAVSGDELYYECNQLLWRVNRNGGMPQRIENEQWPTSGRLEPLPRFDSSTPEYRGLAAAARRALGNTKPDDAVQIIFYQHNRVLFHVATSDHNRYWSYFGIAAKE